jgi:trimeric autotransporter adhesin
MKTKILQKAFVSLTALTLVCFGLSPQARAVCQEGCLTNESTVLGDNALLNNIGNGNTAIGYLALYSNTTGNNNTANGAFALDSNTIGNSNTANGYAALADNTTGVGNTANGFFALSRNTTGGNNTATGALALVNNTSFNNTANGAFALTSNTTGGSNTADGTNSLLNNTSGNSNVAAGDRALSANTTGSSNIALGAAAGINLTTGSNNIYIGNAGSGAGESAKIRIGTTGTQTRTFIAGISGVTVPAGVGVIVGTDGKLGTVVSSARFKAEIKPMDKASEAILSFKPVTFRYKKELDPDGIPQFGLVAEQVEKVNPALVARDADGKAYTVRYEAVNAMLLNEFLKEHRKVEEQQATIAQLKAADGKQEEKISALTELVKAQAAQIQKVSAQLELNRPTPRIVVENR